MNRKSSTLAAAALAALFLSGHAAAQNSGWYLGGGPSSSRAKFERGDFVSLANATTYSADDTDVGLKVFGGYKVSPNVALEFGIASIGRFQHRFSSGAGNYAVFNYDASAATVAIAGSLPLGGGFAVQGRAGVAFTAARLALASRSGSVTVNSTQCMNSFFDDCVSTSTNLMWGIGAQYDVNPRWGMRLDYDNYGKIGDEFETGRAKADAWSANVVYRF
jgi:OOP family OmpA-OmpF porin